MKVIASALKAETASVQDEWDRIAASVKPQIEMGKPSKVPSSLDEPTLISGKCKCNINPAQLRKLLSGLGYKFRPRKSEHEFHYAWNDQKQYQLYILDQVGHVMLCTY